MKRILSFTLSIAAVLALMHPTAASAQMPTPTPKYKKAGGGGPAPQNFKPAVQPQYKPVVHATPPLKPVVHPTPGPLKPYVKPQIVKATPTPKGITKPILTKPKFGGSTPAPGGKPAAVNTKIINTHIHIKQNNKNFAGPKGGGGGGGGSPQFTQANNYGGHWVSGDSHTDWNRGQEHDWDGHHWRWFNGGWLNIDGGFWPAGYYNYYNNPSKIYDAQAILANMGYYNGTVDGVPGPMTRQAIADFQTDNSLPVDGHLNPPTQYALGLAQPPPQD